MIATGGLLRINARRQDSLRSKPHRSHPHKKKSKNKRRSEVVVVKGKLKLCSISGLVAVLGILVLIVGVLMAALGYWPRDGLFFSSQPQEGTTMALMSFSSPAPALVEGQEPRWAESDRGDRTNDRGNGFNQSETVNGTSRDVPQGFLEDFLDRYLYSDRLKVFGPLIMGIGIFLFICANAVLHENRDKKTKVINLRDIYSTVIDLHSVRKPHPSSSGSAHQPLANPLNGLINYVQSKSLESKSQMCPATLLLSRQPASSRRCSDGGGGGEVFSVCQEHLPAPPPSSSNRHSLPLTSDPCWTPHHKEALSSFTLPRPRQRSPSARRRHSFWARSSGQEEEQKEEEMQPPPLCASTPPPHRGSEALLLLSSSSLSSLSQLLSSSSSTPAPPCRRQSLPTAAFNTAYCKLAQGEDESFEWSSSHKVTPEVEAQPSQPETP
ncbi:transmembrane protein 200C-like [Poecilia formosa]|uniref:Transmembrane protein 200C n=1 Tax=Poecilia formosa TaxID=48698 RepID=A0A087XUG7_POEFO|nr:PREDICTED: transmembrane protein 200C-like [Poecilia formosa]XP_016518596.1 PREDICTED: transmembrane protein 200C-like [Poecilia formosa]XP_016518597.1 PREDICTED: transmembrane protein 200C-like [Poecilia formosa]XP_016518598.1 PREDICTED: transmembrane protein 200C-like [Poecilia formosa]XP_016518599.1 PREDICTED: transmembrane protein 200C-like [Poecilia formosa]XP_016518600.1 PREDICTED: transmembrane protein 200C-like [Poecilia formosa]XP_016518601.1 PREDICTED: transmembrane protein 200C-